MAERMTLATALSLLLGRRLLQAALLALLVGTACFAMVEVLPGDLATRIAAGRYGYDLVGSAAADAVRTELRLDQPRWQALLAWWGQLARADLGVSLLSGEAVWHEVLTHLVATAQLTAAALLLALLSGVPLGVAAALRPRGRLARACAVWIALGRGLPPFLTGVLLMVLLAVHLRWLPVAGPEGAGWVLPALTLAWGSAAGLAHITRQAVSQVLMSPSYHFARTKGLSDGQALLRHVLRHAAVPVVAYLGLQAIWLAEGALVIETLFAWPGIGHALVHAVFGRDVPMIQGAAIGLGCGVLLVNLAVDAACLALDPRPRHSTGDTP